MLDAIRWDTDLIHRYDLAGPRYTSYPTAVQFTSQVGTFDLLHALRDSRKAVRPLSLYVHVPFCANICYYCACNKVITKDRGRAQAYLQRLDPGAALRTSLEVFGPYIGTPYRFNEAVEDGVVLDADLAHKTE